MAISSGVRSSLSLARLHTQSAHSNAVPANPPPDEDALRWAEAVRQKRQSKRKRLEDEDDDLVIVGTKLEEGHINYVTAYNMLTGIRFVVSRTMAKMDRELVPADFDPKGTKHSFDVNGNELSPSTRYDFKFKDYCPWVFRKLRARFHLDPADYLISLTGKYIVSELGSPGKSGSFFYFSRDYKYIIKTIHHGEHKFLRKILKDYHQHVEEYPNTLLSQFSGLHRVKMPYGRKIHFVVMNNLFPPHLDIHQTFDLKGSTVGRDFREADLERNPRATLKDLNWLRRNRHFEFGPEKKAILLEQIHCDVALLQRLNIMDYSMLVGIHDLSRGNGENLRDKTLQVFQPGGGGGGGGGGDTSREPTEGTGTERHSISGSLARTPSKLENARKARELRKAIKQERPIPMEQSSSRMPEAIEESDQKKELIFYSDDGGFRATHENNAPGEEIYFLSIIDCLTRYGTVKKAESFWKGLSNDKRLISPVSPIPYGERFKSFMQGITKSSEEAAAEEAARDHDTGAGTGGYSIDGTGNGTVRSRNTTSSDRHAATGSAGGSASHPLRVLRTDTANSTIVRNELEAIKSEEELLRRSGSPETALDEGRVISTILVQGSQGGGGVNSHVIGVAGGSAHAREAASVQTVQTVLAVVEEVGEQGQNGGGGVRRSMDGQSDEKRELREMLAKEDVNANASVDGHVKRRPVSRQSLDKELPMLPQAS